MEAEALLRWHARQQQVIARHGDNEAVQSFVESMLERCCYGPFSVEVQNSIVDSEQSGAAFNPDLATPFRFDQKGGSATTTGLEWPTADQQIDALPFEVRQALTAFDDRLVKALEASVVRLVDMPWLLAQPAGFKMPYRQQLEELERSGVSPSPLVNPEEAAALVRRGDRSVGAVTQYLSGSQPYLCSCQLLCLLSLMHMSNPRVAVGGCPREIQTLQGDGCMFCNGN